MTGDIYAVKCPFENTSGKCMFPACGCQTSNVPVGYGSNGWYCPGCKNYHAPTCMSCPNVIPSPTVANADAAPTLAEATTIFQNPETLSSWTGRRSAKDRRAHQSYIYLGCYYRHQDGWCASSRKTDRRK